MTTESLPTTSKALLDRLERHYIKPSEALPGGVFIREVGINSGAKQTRCDAVYAGFTSTSGRLLVGHEVKTSKQDWQKELDQSGKSDFWHDNTHQWWIVAPSTAIVPPESLPHGWGLMIPATRTTTRMTVMVPAMTRADVVPSWTATRSLLARQDTLRAQAIHQAQQNARHDADERIGAVRDEMQRAGLGRSDGTINRLSGILNEARAQLRKEEIWGELSDEDVIQALVDITVTRGAARQLQAQIREIVRSAEQVAKPFANNYGALQALLKRSEIL